MVALLTSPASVYAAAEPLAGATPIDAGGVVRLMLGLLVVVIAIVATAWSLRRWGHLRSSPRGELRIIGGLSMGPRERLVLVKVGDEQLLLGVASGSIRMLHKLAQPVAVTDGVAPSESFAAKMRVALGQGGGA